MMATQSVITAPLQGQTGRGEKVKTLHVPGLLARRPVVGLFIFIFGSLLFGALAYNLLGQGSLLAVDKSMATTLPAIGLRGPAYLKGVMDAGFYIGDQVIVGLGVLLSLYFLIRRFWREFAMVTIGLAGSSLLFLTLSHLFARPRPVTQIWMVLHIPGFPSGHAISVVAFYGLLAYLLVPKVSPWFLKAVVVAAALLVIGFVGFSRVFTAGHYLTDVLAGYAVGLAWAGAAYTLIELYVQHRKRKNVQKA
jgi:membrane-associated phospholipid phosphatase